MRKQQTDAERHLWQRLRNRQCVGLKFRRQVAIGPYIADFICLEPKIVVEVDGSQHLEQLDYDTQRSLHFKARGYTVLRFWNNEVLSDIESVMESIRLVIDSLTPTLSLRERE